MRNTLPDVIAQMPHSWHNGGMFIGMHWLWWSFWIVTLLLLAWALWRAVADRSETHRQVRREESAEDELRRRFARGEIDEEELHHRIRVLHETHPSGGR